MRSIALSRGKIFGAPAARRYQRCRYFCSTSSEQGDTLRILFCGADKFSIESLKALHAEAKTANGNIISIDVVTKKDKKTGRGLKQIKSTPIKSVALELGLPLHQIDTFTGWTPPSYGSGAINLVIAVSFGLLVPPRILKGSKYGGLNVHPSLLPDLRGAAPIQWSLILGRRETGVSIQTLHPSKYDEGVILQQTPPLPIPNFDTITYEEEQARLARIGAAMLVKSIRDRLYIPPYRAVETNAFESMAPRITRPDKAIDFQVMTREDILNRNRAIPKLFAMAEQRDGTTVRIVFERTMRGLKDDIPHECLDKCKEVPIGVPYCLTSISQHVSSCSSPLFINTKAASGQFECIVAEDLTIAGSPRGPAAAAVARCHLLSHRSTVGRHELHAFDKPLFQDRFSA